MSPPLVQPNQLALGYDVTLHSTFEFGFVSLRAETQHHVERIELKEITMGA
jgi:hypothetical protein